MAARLTRAQVKALLGRQGSLLDSQELKPTRLHTGMSNASESEIQSAIIQYLERCTDVAWAKRINTGQTKYSGHDGKPRFVRFGFVGCSDILGQLTDGRMLAIEVKTARGKASPEQVAFLQTVAAANGVSILARSVDDVIDGIKAAKLPLNSHKHTA
jgi:hypothetical protein